MQVIGFGPAGFGGPPDDGGFKDNDLVVEVLDFIQDKNLCFRLGLGIGVIRRAGVELGKILRNGFFVVPIGITG